MNPGYHEADDHITDALGANWRAAVASYRSTAQRIDTAASKIKEIWRRHEEDRERRRQARELYQNAWEEAREKLEVIEDPQWRWEEATPEQIADLYGHALGWKDHEVQAEEAEEHIHHMVREYYGLDLREGKSVEERVEQIRSDLEEVKQAHAGIEGEEGEHDRETRPAEPEPVPDRAEPERPAAAEEAPAATREEREAVELARTGMPDAAEAARARRSLKARSTRPRTPERGASVGR
ncbi:hypothetical protein [Nocardiopsis baichengensis]|uniref:hypothetical protein n=1 Tax=Nocardiopsis baichengensis TaxID=280240 RepID=UPI00037EDA53|nr:hypothetical protein [Nocardiopsis baichengensis]